jgi:hypothetical protein
MLIDHFTWIPQIWVSSFLKITLVYLVSIEEEKRFLSPSFHSSLRPA